MGWKRSNAPRRASVLAASVAVFAALSISGCGGSSSSGGSTGGGSSPAASGKKAPYTIVLANGFVGNEYKVEMENDFKAAVQMSPYKSIVKSSVYNAGDSVGTQTSQLQSIIASRPDAILLDSNSPTAENSVVQQACSEGIVVVTYDNEATAPCAAKISTSPAYFAKLNADYIVKELHGKGNVVMVTGVPGAPVDTIRNQVAEKIFAKYPGIHIIDKVVGQWDSATVERVLAPVIATYQNINAVWVSAGTDGAVTAFQQAGRKLPIIAGESENGFRVAIAKYAKDGFKGQSVDGSPVYLSVLALQYAIDVLEGKRKRGENIVFKPFVMTGANAKLGVNAFPNLPKGTFDDFQSPYVPMCPVGALKGTRCPGTLKVRIPPTS